MLDDVQEDPNAEDKATFGSYRASDDEELKQEEPPFDVAEQRLDDGTVIKKDFYGEWYDASNPSRKFTPSGIGSFIEQN